MATFKKNKSGGSQSDGGSNSASPASSVALSNAGSTQGINNNAPKYGTLVPNRIFVGGISSNTTETELSQLFSKYGSVKATKIIADRAGVSKGYGFVTFETEEEVKALLQDSNNIVFKERRLNVAPAVKKQPSGRYDSSSPPPTTTPILHFANGVPFTYHNGMAFFPPTAHQPTIAALPPSADPSMYPSYSPAPNTAPAPYGTSVIVPGPQFLMPQNYSYQPLSMTNGAATHFIYPGSGSPSSSSGSPMANTPETHHPVPSVLPPQYFTPQFTPQEAFYSPYYISYSSSASVYADYDSQDQQTNDDRSSTISTPHSDVSERSGDRSPAVITRFTQHRSQQFEASRPSSTHSNDSQVPVVSWKNTYSEEREIFIRDGRRSFHPIVPPPTPSPSTPTQRNHMLYYQRPQFPGNFTSSNTVFQQTKSTAETRNQRHNPRGRPSRSVTASTMPYIPKFPACFNNNNPLITNNNFHDKKPTDPNIRGNRQGNRNLSGGYFRGNNSRNSSPPNPKSTNSSPTPQMMPVQPQHFERPTYVMAANSAPRWSNVPQNSSHQMKRMTNNKKQNGANANLGGNNGIRLTKKIQGDVVEQDVGGGGDAQLSMNRNSSSPGANHAEITSKMQTLALESSS